MVFEAFLTIPGIPGDIQFLPVPNSIILESWEWGFERPFNPTTGVLGTTLMPRLVRLAAHADRSWPKLAAAAGSSAVFSNCDIQVYVSADIPTRLVHRLTLFNVRVESHETSANEGGYYVPTQYFSLSYTAWTMESNYIGLDGASFNYKQTYRVA